MSRDVPVTSVVGLRFLDFFPRIFQPTQRFQEIYRRWRTPVPKGRYNLCPARQCREMERKDV